MQVTPAPVEEDDDPNDSSAHLIFGVIVVLGAGVLTAHGLWEVAFTSRVPGTIAWIYPVITDGLALVAYVATHHLREAARAYAWTVVVISAGLSGLAQAVYLAGGTENVSSGLAFGVGAWPAICAGLAAHLLFLLRQGRRKAQRAAEARRRQEIADRAAARKAEQERAEELAVRKLEALERLETARNRPAPPIRRPARKPATKAPAASNVPEKADQGAGPAPEIGQGSARQQMLDYLDANAQPTNVNGKWVAARENGETVTGGFLDSEYGTNNYGRGVIKTWLDKHPTTTTAAAAGE